MNSPSNLYADFSIFKSFKTTKNSVVMSLSYFISLFFLLQTSYFYQYYYRRVCIYIYSVWFYGSTCGLLCNDEIPQTTLYTNRKLSFFYFALFFLSTTFCNHFKNVKQYKLRNTLFEGFHKHTHTFTILQETTKISSGTPFVLPPPKHKKKKTPAKSETKLHFEGFFNNKKK